MNPKAPKSIAECFAVLNDALKVIRAHWGVENKLHWVLDVEFGEDASRVRTANAAQNLNTLRKFAIDFLRKDKTTNHTFKKKRRIMMWDDTMLQRIIVGKQPSRETSKETIRAYGAAGTVRCHEGHSGSLNGPKDTPASEY